MRAGFSKNNMRRKFSPPLGKNALWTSENLVKKFDEHQAQNTGKNQSRQECRRIFYRELRDQYVWTFDERVAQDRVNVAVDQLVSVVKKVHEKYELRIRDYLRLLSHVDRQVFPIYKFLFDFVGDLVEKEVGSDSIFTMKWTAEALAGRGGEGEAKED